MTTPPEFILMKPERESKTDRSKRILDAAADLLLRYGYNRITIEDIAQQAGIGKGTIYLHWKTKDELFGTLILREAISLWKELLEHLRRDPSHVLFSNVMRSMMLIGMRRPLARALFLLDRGTLGKLIESRIDPAKRAQQAIVRDDLLAILRREGLLRSDTGLAIQAYALRATVTGFLAIEPVLKDGNQLPLEEKANALAQTVHAAFEPVEIPPPEVLVEIAARMAGWLENLIAGFEQQMR